MEERLLLDCCVDPTFVMQLTESTKNGRVKFRGKFQEADAVNKNKRMYPRNVLDENVKKLQETIKRRALLGELDHPSDSVVHYSDASHVVTKLWWEGNILMGEGEILGTPNGQILKALIEDGIPIGMSSRGVGNGTTNENGILVIGESYKLITFDAVADPSTFYAFQEKVVDNKSSRNEEIARNHEEILVKNETTRIDTVSKEALIACLGGIVKSQVELIKQRLS